MTDHSVQGIPDPLKKPAGLALGSSGAGAGGALVNGEVVMVYWLAGIPRVARPQKHLWSVTVSVVTAQSRGLAVRWPVTPA